MHMLHVLCGCHIALSCMCKVRLRSPPVSTPRQRHVIDVPHCTQQAEGHRLCRHRCINWVSEWSHLLVMGLDIQEACCIIFVDLLRFLTKSFDRLQNVLVASIDWAPSMVDS